MSFLNETKLLYKDLKQLFKGSPGIVAFQIGLNDVASDGFIMARRKDKSYKIEFKVQFPIAIRLSVKRAQREIVRQARELGYDVCYVATRRTRGYTENTVNFNNFPKE